MDHSSKPIKPWKYLTDMGLSTEQAPPRASGAYVTSPTATGRKLMVTADGKAIDMDANMIGGEQVSKKFKVVTVFLVGQ